MSDLYDVKRKKKLTRCRAYTFLGRRCKQVSCINGFCFTHVKAWQEDRLKAFIPLGCSICVEYYKCDLAKRGKYFNCETRLGIKEQLRGEKSE